MSKSKMTVLGIENYLNSINDSLFSDIIIPSDIVKDDLIDTILLRSGEFEVLYPQPDFLKSAITLWSRKNNRTFTRWVTALNIEYNPLENYDRMEDWTDDNTGTVTDDGYNQHSGNIKDSGTTVNTGSSRDDTHTPQLITTTENSRSAYDSDTFVNDTKSVSSTNEVDAYTTHTNNNLTETIDITHADTTRIENNNIRTDNLHTHRVGRAHGNIGVTTSQQMLESELDIARWNLYDQIADLFITEFCLLVY